MGTRKDKLITGNYYHIFTRSISGITLFRDPKEYQKMLATILYYRENDPPCPLSMYRKLSDLSPRTSVPALKSKLLTEIIAYCLMPNHIHLILKQLIDDGISKMLECVLKSYAHYFNKKTERKGPLWEGKFQNVLVESNEQMLHLTRYIHLNPVTAYQVEKPENWHSTSYHEYIGTCPEERKICKFNGIIDIKPDHYRKLTEDRIDYQRKLAKIKSLILE